MWHWGIKSVVSNRHFYTLHWFSFNGVLLIVAITSAPSPSSVRVHKASISLYRK